jgi:hypothetical protein
VIIDVLQHTVLITSFVFVIMLLVEYLNVQTKGKWQKTIKKSKPVQYLISAVLGGIPGCLGSFTVVSLYSHGVVSFGALVTTMIATSGDEAYVMLSLFPEKAIFLTIIISIIGIVIGILVDLFYKKQEALLEKLGHSLQLHEEELIEKQPRGYILQQLRNITFERTLMISLLVLFLILIIGSFVEPHEWNWVRITLIISSLFALFVVTTVPDHFLEEHLWQHVLKRHLLRIFLWTLGALLVINILQSFLDVESWIQANTFTVLIIAVLIGIIPESGPHLIFVTLFASGSIPFSILMASSIVQDGHGTLPLLAVSKKGFVYLKAINVVVGFVFGVLGILLGF